MDEMNRKLEQFFPIRLVNKPDTSCAAALYEKLFMKDDGFLDVMEINENEQYRKTSEAAERKEAGLEEYFMGLKQKAGFIGHGVGIEVNEMPVIAPRSRDILEAGNVIALEPKFVIPSVGAVGIENTYVVRDNGLECLTNAPEEIAELY